MAASRPFAACWYRMATPGVVCPMRSISSANVAPVGRERCGGVAQIVKTQIRSAGGLAGGVEDSGERRRPQVPVWVMGGRKSRPSLPTPCRRRCSRTAGRRWGGMGVSHYLRRIWGSSRRLLVDPDDGTAELDHAAASVDVFAAQFGQFAISETTPGGEQDHESVPLGHRARVASSSSVAGSVLIPGGPARTPNTARVRHDQVIGDGGRADGPQEGVRVCPKRGPIDAVRACHCRITAGVSLPQRKLT